MCTSTTHRKGGKVAASGKASVKGAPLTPPASTSNSTHASDDDSASEEDITIAPSANDKTSFIFRKLLHRDAKISKLKTPEDRNHIHKTFGILSVCSFLFRYAYMYNVHGNLGFNTNFFEIETLNDEKMWMFDFASIAVHTLLAFSSIIFRVPKKRLPNKPMVIYEEYRQHAMVFTLRCSLVWFATMCLPNGKLFGITMRPIMVLACHLFVDRITSIHGTAGNTAVRVNAETLSSFYQKVARGYSFYQFLAIASHLLASDREGDMGYNAIIAIQSSAFMMTLYRKRIVRGTTHMAIYSFCLLVSAFHIVRVIGWYHMALTLAAFTLRINLPRGVLSSKYVIWPAFMLVANLPWLIEAFAGVETLDMAKNVVLNNESVFNTFKGVALAATVYNVASIEERVRTAKKSVEA